MDIVFPRANPDLKRVGLILNPLAGIGGRVGLKGSDGPEIQRRALELGAVSEVQARAHMALDMLQPLLDNLEIITFPGEMGETAARLAGFEPLVVGKVSAGASSAQDTRLAAQAMKLAGVKLLLFAGGDGTARDILDAVGFDLPVLGIPAGVKIHSAVFGTHAAHAGELAQLYLQGRSIGLHEAEVMDMDEEAYRSGILSARLYGYLKIPFKRQLVQGQKVPTPASEAALAEAVAQDFVENLQADCLYILGPGTTLRTVAHRLGLEKTLVGVDVVHTQSAAHPLRMLLYDARESQLMEILQSRGVPPVKIVVTPIGGQGFIFGRGNQQISPKVIQKVGRENIIVLGTASKLNALRGRPLLVDTGDERVDAILAGRMQVKTGYHESSVYRVGN
jgi:predicted polyphosphate/ATP-dependent NAD kinase